MLGTGAILLALLEPPSAFVDPRMLDHKKDGKNQNLSKDQLKALKKKTARNKKKNKNPVTKLEIFAAKRERRSQRRKAKKEVRNSNQIVSEKSTEALQSCRKKKGWGRLDSVQKLLWVNADHPIFCFYVLISH
jgi:hypothetical protein